MGAKKLGYAFAAMPHAVVFDKRLSNDAFRLYSMLIAKAGQKRHLRVKIKTMSEMMDCSIRKISLLIKELALLGLIKRYRTWKTANTVLMFEFLYENMDKPNISNPKSLEKIDAGARLCPRPEKEKYFYLDFIPATYMLPNIYNNNCSEYRCAQPCISGCAQPCQSVNRSNCSPNNKQENINEKENVKAANAVLNPSLSPKQVSYSQGTLFGGAKLRMFRKLNIPEKNADFDETSKTAPKSIITYYGGQVGINLYPGCLGSPVAKANAEFGDGGSSMAAGFGGSVTATPKDGFAVTAKDKIAVTAKSGLGDTGGTDINKDLSKNDKKVIAGRNNMVIEVNPETGERMVVKKKAAVKKENKSGKGGKEIFVLWRIWRMFLFQHFGLPMNVPPTGGDIGHLKNYFAASGRDLDFAKRGIELMFLDWNAIQDRFKIAGSVNVPSTYLLDTLKNEILYGVKQGGISTRKHRVSSFGDNNNKQEKKTKSKLEAAWERA